MNQSQSTLAISRSIAGFIICIATALILALTSTSRKPDAYHEFPE